MDTATQQRMLEHCREIDRMATEFIKTFLATDQAPIQWPEETEGRA